MTSERAHGSPPSSAGNGRGPLPRSRTGRSRSHRSAGAALTVRVATTRDLPTVLAMRAALVADEARNTRRTFRVHRQGAAGRPDIDPSRGTTTQPHVPIGAKPRSANQLSEPGQITMIAFRDDTAVGLLRCILSGEPGRNGEGRYGFLASAFVVRSQRRAGVLRALVRAAEGWCASLGVRELRLRCSLDNAGGNAAWSALGYTPMALVRRRRLPVT